MEDNLNAKPYQSLKWKWSVITFLLCVLFIHFNSQAQTTSCTGTISPATGTICRGEQFGLIVSGGTSYQWYKDGVAIAGETSQSILITSGGTYTADIFNNGCVGKASNASVITEAFDGEATISPFRLTICNGGSGLLTATGGDSYQWYLNGSAIPGAQSSIYMVTEPGTYAIDAIKNNCTWREAALAFVEVREDLNGPLNPATAVLCPGDSLTLSAEGGITYKWYKDNVLIPNATADTFTVKMPGVYAFELFRGECKGRSSNNAVITAGVMPTGTVSPSSAIVCGNDAVSLKAVGGIRYQWYRNNVKINNATTATYAASQPGTYTASIFNEGGCEAKSSNESIVTQQAKPVGSITPGTLTICEGSTGTLTANGGDAYQWYHNGTPISGASIATINVTKSGKYTVDIKSGTCKAAGTNEANITVTPKPRGVISPASLSVCNGGTGTLKVDGGTSYQWYKDGVMINGATQSTIIVKDAGVYSADIIKGDCKEKADNEVTITIIPKPAGTITPATASICKGNSVTLTATGGTSYQWLKEGQIINGATVATYNAIEPGQYSVTITSGNCSGPSNNTVTVSYSKPITFKTTSTAAGCTVANGTIEVGTVEGGSSVGYQYSKDNGQTYQPDNKFKDLAPGQYQIVVKDGSGCKSEPVSVSVTQIVSTLGVSATPVDIACSQQFGKATITVTGGVAPYTYKLNDAADQSGNAFTNLAAGNYVVQVKDALGCSAETKFAIRQLASTLTANTNVTEPTCTGTMGRVDVSVNGGTPNYQFSLDNGAYQNGSAFTNIAIGKHTVSVKDNVGCVINVTFEIKSGPGAPSLMVTNPVPICPGTTVSLKEAAITAGSDAGLTFTYWKDAGASNELANPESVGGGTYYIKGTGASGCFIIKPVVISINNTTAGSISPANPEPLCNGEFMQLTASSGISYQWYKDGVAINGATAATYKATQAGSYSVLIDNGTCAAMASNTVVAKYKVCVPTGETRVFVPTAFTPNGNSENDVLMPYFINIRQLVQFKVFNRWGQLVYQTNIIGQGWDGILKGTPQPADTYSWILECIDNDGKVIRQSGRSVLIR